MMDELSSEAQVVEVALPNGARALVRVRDVDGGGGAEKVRWDDRLDFQGVADAVGGVAEALRGSLAKVAPRKVTVELGVELAIKSGKLTGLLVEGEGKGSLAVTLEWSSAPGGEQ